MTSDRAVFLHARYITSDFDQGGGPGHLLDPEAYEGAERAVEPVLEYLKSIAHVYPRIADCNLREILPDRMLSASRNYWIDFDFNDRKRSSDVKNDLAKLVKLLSPVIDELQRLPPYIGNALQQASLKITADTTKNISLRDAVIFNQLLLETCQVYTNRQHTKAGRSIRFDSACRDLMSLWVTITGKPFTRDVKTAFDNKQRDRNAFTKHAAEFLFIALSAIHGGTIKRAKVGAAMQAVWKAEGSAKRSETCEAAAEEK